MVSIEVKAIFPKLKKIHFFCLVCIVDVILIAKD